MPFGRVGADEFGTYFIGYARTRERDRADADEHVHRQPARHLRPRARLLDSGHRQPVLRPQRRVSSTTRPRPPRPGARSEKRSPHDPTRPQPPPAAASPDGSLRHRQPGRTEGPTMNHLLRSHAPISDTGLGADRRGGARAAAAGARRPQARRLLRAARLGALGHEPRAHRPRCRARRRGRLRPARECCRSSSCARTSSSRAKSCATSTAAPTTPTSSRSTAPRIRSRSPRTPPCSRLADAIKGVAEVSPYQQQPLGSAPEHYPQRIARAVGELRTQRRRRPLRRWRSGPSTTGSRSETAEHGGTLLIEHLPEILDGGPIVWTPGPARRRRDQPARRRLHPRIRPGPVGRLRLTRRRRRSSSTSRRASASASRRPRPRSS